MLFFLKSTLLTAVLLLAISTQGYTEPLPKLCFYQKTQDEPVIQTQLARQKMRLFEHEHVEGKSWPAIAIGLFVAFGGVLYGYVSFSVAVAKCKLTVADMILVPLAVSWPCLTGRLCSPPDITTHLAT